MKPAPREALRRFGITAAAFVATWSITGVAGHLVKPVIDANPRNIVGIIYFAMLVASFIAFGVTLFYVMGPMKSKCPRCGERSARLMARADWTIDFACTRCGYAEPTGWMRD